MSSVRFMQRISLIPKVPRINGNPFIEGDFICPQSRKKQRVRISTIRKCLEDGEPEAVVKFIDKAPQYLPYVVAAMIDLDESVAFNAEWCVRRIACSASDITKTLLRHSLSYFLVSPWILAGKRAEEQRAVELSKEMRELHDFISY
jgi:hypothetical protein